MKTYRPALADSFALDSLLRFAAAESDSLTEDANRYFASAQENLSENGDPDSYYLDAAKECEAKAEAFERLITKLSK